MPMPPVPAAEAARQRARRQRLRRRIMVAIYGVPLLLLALAVYLAYGPKPPPPPVVLPVSPQQAAAVAQRIDAVRQALIQPPPAPAVPGTAQSPLSGSGTRALPPLAHPAPPAHPMPPPPVEVTRRPNGNDQVTMRLSQTDVNAYLASDPKSVALLRAHGVQAVSVNFDPPNQITIHAAADFHGVSGDGIIHAAIVPDPQTGVRLNITDARFGRLPPPALTATANSLVNSLLRRQHAPLGLSIRSAQIDGTELVITGVRPAAQ